MAWLWMVVGLAGIAHWALESSVLRMTATVKPTDRRLGKDSLGKRLVFWGVSPDRPVSVASWIVASLSLALVCATLGLTVIGWILESGDVRFFAALVGYAVLALSCVTLLFEMVMDWITEIKQDLKNREE